jgi:polyribonucleotide nucleotidyltransferase
VPLEFLPSLWLIHYAMQSTEFDIERDYVGRVVGAQGSGINRLREALGVKVDVSDEADEKEAGKRKKVIHQKSKIKVIALLTFFPLLVSHCNRKIDYRSQGKCGRSQETNPVAGREDCKSSHN